MRIPFHFRMMLACALLAMLGCADATAAEWDQLLATFGNLTTKVAGPYTASGNPNEWKLYMEGGSAYTAELSEPHTAMDDIWGNIYVADKNAHAIRKITLDGKIVTVAGRHIYYNPNQGSYDGDGIATQHALSYPNGLTVFPDGTFFFLETGDSGTLGRIRKVDRAGIMTTLYSDTGGTLQRGLWVAPDESYMYFCTSKKLKKWLATAPASPSTLLDLSSNNNADLGNIDVAQNGSIYVTDRGNHWVYAVPPGSLNVTSPAKVAGNGGTDSSSNGDVSSRDNSAATSVPMEEVRGIAFHPLGGYFLACHKGGDIWYVDTAGNVHVVLQGGSSGSTMAGEGMPITSSRSTLKIAEPRSVRVGWHGSLIICTNDNGYLRVVPSVVPVTGISPTCNGLRQLTWNGEMGQGYFVERSATLLANDWTTVNRRYPASNGPQVYSETISMSALPKAFYRVYGHRKWPF